MKVFKKWWFWLIVAIVVIAIIAGSSGSSESDVCTGEIQNESSQSTEIVYEIVDLQTMIDDLKANSLRAEENYKEKYVEITGKISNIDSDGKYISISPDNDEFNLTSVMCYIKNDEQKQIIINKSTDDIVTIKGKIKSIGEVLGYSLDIKEIK